MKLSPKMISGLIIASGSIGGYLIARAGNGDKTLGVMLGTLIGKLADDIFVEQNQRQHVPEIKVAA